MLKTLRIASIFTVIAAAVVVGSVGMFGLRANPDIQAFLNREGIIEQIRNRAQNVPQKVDAVSPLESAAKAFALRIDPPPPPKPPTPPKPTTPQAEVKPPPVVVKPPPVIQKPQLSAKFSLVATARYKSHPDKSLALLKSLQNEYTWYRQGEKVGHLDLQEVKDGSVVLYQDGRFNSEIFMPPPPKEKSLLKGDQQEEPAPQNSSSVAVISSESTGQEVVVTAPSSSSPPSVPGRRTIPSRLPASANRVPSESIATRRIPSRPVRSIPQPTPEEQKQSIESSISSIEDIMNRAPVEGVTEEQQKQEQEAWKQLLQVLQQERGNLEEGNENSGQAAVPSEEQEKPQSESKNSDKVK